jgi:hypothetical protein
LLELLNEPRTGVARFAARELGVLAGRNWLLSLLISLLRLGRQDDREQPQHDDDPAEADDDAR